MKFLPENKTMKKIASYSFGALGLGAVVGMSYFGYVNQIPVSAFTNVQLNMAANLGTYGTVIVGTWAKITQFTGAQYALATAYGTAFVSLVGGAILGTFKAVQNVINVAKANEAGQILQSASNSLGAQRALEREVELEENLQAEREIEGHLQAEQARVSVRDTAVPFEITIFPAQKTSSARSIETFTTTSTLPIIGEVINPDVVLTPTRNLPALESAVLASEPQSSKFVKRKLTYIDPSLLESPANAVEGDKPVEEIPASPEPARPPSPIQTRSHVAADALRAPSPTYNLRSRSPARELANPAEVDVANILDKPSNSNSPRP